MVKLCTIKEAMVQLHKSEGALRDWVLRGKIDVQRVGRAIYIRQETIDKILEEGFAPAVPQPGRKPPTGHFPRAVRKVG